LGLKLGNLAGNQPKQPKVLSKDAKTMSLSDYKQRMGI